MGGGGGAGIDCVQSMGGWDRLCTINGVGIDCVPSMGAGIDCVPSMGLRYTVYHQWGWDILCTINRGLE